MNAPASGVLRGVVIFPMLFVPACSPVPPVRPVDDPVVALVNGMPLRTSSLAPTLLELAGEQALREHVLDEILAARRASTPVTEAMIARELTLLKREGPTVPPTRQQRIALRNATLRALVAPTIVVTDAQIAQLHNIRHGRRARVSVIVVPDERSAAAVLDRVRAGGDDIFASIARAESIDASAARGGTLGIVSPSDPALPLALRNAISRAMSDQTLGPILVPIGVAVVRVHELIDADEESSKPISRDAADELRTELRARLESEAMETLAQSLLGQSVITTISEHLPRVK